MANRTSRARAHHVVSAFGLVLFAAHPASADLVFGVEVGAGHSDNIRRVPTGEENETIGALGFDLAWRERTRRLDADATVDLSYFEYLDDTYDGEVVGVADASVVLGIVPDRFSWTFEDSFGQAQADPFAPATPDTRENLNYFSTGPDLSVRLGSAAMFALFGRYSATEYEQSLLDAERLTGGVALRRKPTERSELALNAVTEAIDFEDEVNEDYDRRYLFLSYEITGARTELTTRAGYTWLEQDEGEETGGALFDLSVMRELSPSSTLLLELGSQLTDASESLRSTGGQVGGADITATADPFENRFATLEWRFSRNRTSFILGAGWNEDRYEEQTQFDRTRFIYNAGFNRRISPTLEFGVLGSYTDEEFDETGETSEELSFGANLTWRPGRTLGFVLTFDRFDRNTATTQIGVPPNLGEFVENRVFLMLEYRPLGRALPPVGPAARP